MARLLYRHAGSLAIGRCADIAVFELTSVDVELEDCIGQLRHCSQRLLTKAVWRAGERCRFGVLSWTRLLIDLCVDVGVHAGSLRSLRGPTPNRKPGRRSAGS